MKAIYRSVDDMKPCPGSGTKPERESVCPVCQHWFKHARFTRVTPTHRRWLPGNVECRTCNDFRQVFASRDVERPELDRWYACPDCTTPENVECPVVDENGDHPVEHDGAECWHCGATPENVECQTCNGHGYVDIYDRCPDCTPENVETSSD